MKRRWGWVITSVQGDSLIVLDSDKGTLRWARRHNFKMIRTMVVSSSH